MLHIFRSLPSYYLQDAHNAILDFDTNSSLFAVYDGHGGHEVAVYTAKNLPNYIRKNELYRKGQMDEALVESFVEFDRTITRYWSLFCLHFVNYYFWRAYHLRGNIFIFSRSDQLSTHIHTDL